MNGIEYLPVTGHKYFSTFIENKWSDFSQANKCFRFGCKVEIFVFCSEKVRFQNIEKFNYSIKNKYKMNKRSLTLDGPLPFTLCNRIGIALKR